MPTNAFVLCTIRLVNLSPDLNLIKTLSQVGLNFESLFYKGVSEAGEDVRSMADDIDKDLHKLTDETKERSATLESCLAQIEHYQKVNKGFLYK